MLSNRYCKHLYLGEWLVLRYSPKKLTGHLDYNQHVNMNHTLIASEYQNILSHFSYLWRRQVDRNSINLCDDMKLQKPVQIVANYNFNLFFPKKWKFNSFIFFLIFCLYFSVKFISDVIVIILSLLTQLYICITA